MGREGMQRPQARAQVLHRGEPTDLGGEGAREEVAGVGISQSELLHRRERSHLSDPTSVGMVPLKLLPPTSRYYSEGIWTKLDGMVPLK